MNSAILSSAVARIPESMAILCEALDESTEAAMASSRSGSLRKPKRSRRDALASDQPKP
jgi:hypothetical protein